MSNLFKFLKKDPTTPAKTSFIKAKKSLAAERGLYSPWTLIPTNPKTAKAFHEAKSRSICFWGIVIAIWQAILNINLINNVIQSQQYFRLIQLFWWIPLFFCIIFFRYSHKGIAGFAGFLFFTKMGLYLAV